MPTKKIQVLLIEDDRPTCEALIYALKKRGALAESVARGEDAIAVASRFQPDVIALDIRLAGVMDGYDVMRDLRQHPVLSHVPTVFVTNYGMNQEKARGLAAGALAYLVKSDWSIHDLCEALLGYGQTSLQKAD